jgi:large subunit ribosomal protein L27
MAHTKSGGSTKLGRDSAGRRLGVKKNHGERVLPGQIILRQRGTRYLNGDNVARGGDDTLYALKEGVVRFLSKKKTKFDGRIRSVKVITVEL